jgi:serine/threonine protein kinase
MPGCEDSCVTLAGVAILAVGTELAGYRIDELIGRGGMGVVYRGTDLRLGRPVAIKLIAAERATEPIVRQRFEREARLMASIDHPNVLPVYAAGEEDGSLYLVMRYVAGTDLAELLRQEGRLAPARAARVTEQVAAALDAAHRAGLVHRDIKPANVLLAGEHTYLSDFGIGRAVEAMTRLTDTNDWLGTVDFCSPEQLRGERTGPASDVYSLGCLLQTALTGVPPHHRETTPATMFAHLNERPARASRTEGVPAGFDAVLACALAKRPTDRYKSAGRLAEAARAVIDLGPGGATGGDPPRSRRLLTTRRPGSADATRSRGETRASRTRPLPPQKRTKLDLRPRHRTLPPPHSAPPSARVLAAVVLVSAILIAGIAAAVIAIATGGATSATGPVTRSELAHVVRSFAAAYGKRDPSALAPLLAPTVARVSPGAVERGRVAVLAEYRSQLADGSIIGYQVTGLTEQPGWVARARGQYTVVRSGRADLTGSVAFGVERVNGLPRIILIATEPTAPG